ncbi:MAG: flagellar basal-body rod protein FlgF [Micavibrio aeruginosavorus]|uniref:Flagellar basal-body rod protein FlgF n=1 Tax=Micavibrio aeruginosavorus TaxID=349221 RepID=A0A2W5BTJ7_9BACT|nr:MAG: flagellar basal-body rod protein FlgF [Micavibrio aeruginosavorus]
MENSIYVGLSGQVAMEQKMALIANNVANINTPGYRGQNALFKEFISDQRRMKEDVSLVLDYGQYRVTDAGSVKETGNPLDVALVGPGFMGVQTPDGIQYTRAGNFALNMDGQLVTSQGRLVADAGGGAITVPQDAKYVSIDKGGIISTDQGQIATLMLSEFPDYQRMEPAGNGLYKTEQAALPATETTVLQGKIEGSNVQPVLEMTRMIEVMREYQAVQNMMNNEQDRQRNGLQRMLRTS